MTDSSPPVRPKIEVVRLPSTERAKLKPLLEGGIQLEAQFQHMRYGDYASYSSLDDTSKQYDRFHDYLDHKAPLATKSLDNIFAKQLSGEGQEKKSPFLWRDATRSDEHLYHGSLNLSGTICQPSTPSRFSVARSKISAFLKKLSPRTCHKTVPPTSSYPWVVVEFANQDLDSPDTSGRTNSITSDYSFDMAVKANRLRTEKMMHDSEEQLNMKTSHPSVSTPIPSHSSKQGTVSQVSAMGSDKYSKKEEQKRCRPGPGFAVARHRPAFNTGLNPPPLLNVTVVVSKSSLSLALNRGGGFTLISEEAVKG